MFLDLKNLNTYKKKGKNFLHLSFNVKNYIELKLSTERLY